MVMGVLGGFIIEAMLSVFQEGVPETAGGLFGNGMLIWMLVLAYRGGRISMKLTKGFVVLMALLLVSVLVVIGISLAGGIRLPNAPTLVNTVPTLLKSLGVLYALWALFVSADVREFLAYQREVAGRKILANAPRG